jgi:hypothetical protein
LDVPPGRIARVPCDEKTRDGECRPGSLDGVLEAAYQFADLEKIRRRVERAVPRNGTPGEFCLEEMQGDHVARDRTGAEPRDRRARRLLDLVDLAARVGFRARGKRIVRLETCAVGKGPGDRIGLGIAGHQV